MDICKAVEDMSWKIATEVHDEGLEKDAAIKKIKAEFKFMGAKCKVCSQAMYYPK